MCGLTHYGAHRRLPGLFPFAFVAIWAFAWIAEVNFASEYDKVGAAATLFAVLFAVVVLLAKWYWTRKDAMSHASVSTDLQSVNNHHVLTILEKL